MGSAEIEQIGSYVRANLAEWMADVVGPHVLERTAPVEDALALQRELICTRFEVVDKRFEGLHRSMETRFEAMDKRFEDMHRKMETRFQAVDKRFETVDKRFEDMHRYTDKRFEDMHKRFNGMQWMVGGGVVLLATMMSLFQFFG
ncbi:MAG: hypothetical protein OXJ90_13285 [Spirochaetaceae bacterium]|nr:hypothetical protein [Spirochaetaceae bacterium]